MCEGVASVALQIGNLSPSFDCLVKSMTWRVQLRRPESLQTLFVYYNFSLAEMDFDQNKRFAASADDKSWMG